MVFLFWLLFLVYIAASAVLILVVLVQSGKGGGLSGLVGAGSTLGDTLGATGAEKTLNRWTTYCAVGFLVVTILLVGLGNKVYKRGILDEVEKNLPTTSGMESGALEPGSETGDGSPSAAETPKPPSGPEPPAKIPAPAGGTAPGGTPTPEPAGNEGPAAPDGGEPPPPKPEAE